jgi:hypothetical protein
MVIIVGKRIGRFGSIRERQIECVTGENVNYCLQSVRDPRHREFPSDVPLCPDVVVNQEKKEVESKVYWML